MLNLDLNTFNKNLLITQHYCQEQLGNSQNNNASILRSINPMYDNKKLFEYKLEEFGYQGKELYYEFGVKWSIDPYGNDYPFLFNKLFKEQLDCKLNYVNNFKSDDIFLGEILVFDIGNTLVDGAASVYTHGLFDDYNCPPIDTWIYMTNSSKGLLLFCWIPIQFVKLADMGVSVNPENCIDWLKVWYRDDYDAIKSVNKFEFKNIMLNEGSGLK